MKVRSGSRIAFLVVALLVAVVSANARAGCWQGVTHSNRGLDLQIKGDLEGAIAQYRAVISEWPKICQAHLALGNILEDRGAHEAAIVEYRAVIKPRKKDPEAHYHLGHALQANGELSTPFRMLLPEPFCFQNFALLPGGG